MIKERYKFQEGKNAKKSRRYTECSFYVNLGVTGNILAECTLVASNFISTCRMPCFIVVHDYQGD